MIRFAMLDADGNVTMAGTRKSLPEGAVELPEAYSFPDLARLRYRDGTWEEREDYVPTVEREQTEEDRAIWQATMFDRARAEAVDRINRSVGELRKRIYTDIPGQDAIYLEKRAEAKAYLALSAEPAGLEDFPLIANEIGPGLTARTAYELAQVWLNRSHLFKQIGGATEKARLRAAYAIAEAGDEAAIARIEEVFHEALARLPI